MKTAQYRETVPSAVWISSIQASPRRVPVSLAIITSLLVHLLLIVAIALLLKILPERLKRTAAAGPKTAEIELVVIPPKPKEEPPQALPLEANPQHQFLDSRGLAETSEAAKDAMVESDKNMKAASELPATGTVPLPSQEGVNRPNPNFATQKDMLGAKASAMAIQQTEPQPMESAPPEPVAPALFKPQPIPKANIDPVKNEPARDKPLPAPATMTPPLLPEIEETNALAQRALDKLRKVTQASDDEIPLTAAKPMVTPPKELKDAPPVPKPLAKVLPERPRPLPIPKPKVAATPTPQLAMAATPAPPVPKKEFQPQLQKTKIEGSISNRGKAAVDAVSTPLARYKKQVNDAIGSRWYYYIRGKMDLIAAGSVNMSFSINERGQAVSVKIDSNTSNQSLADVCERAIREAEIEPPPPDLIAPMKDSRLDYSLTFTFYNL